MLCYQCHQEILKTTNYCPNCVSVVDFQLMIQSWKENQSKEENFHPLEYRQQRFTDRLQEFFDVCEIFYLPARWENLNFFKEYTLSAPKLKKLSLPSALLTFQGKYFPHAPLLEDVSFSPELQSFHLGSLQQSKWYENLQKESSPYTIIGDGILLTFDKEIKDVVIPEGVRVISSGCFRNHALESVTFPDSLEEISSLAFYQCDYLSTITFPPQLNSIDTLGFARCFSLKEVNFTSGLRYLGEDVFLETPFQQSLKEEQPLFSVTMFGESLLYEGQNFATFFSHALPMMSNITALASRCFAQEQQLECCYLWDKITTIGKSAFLNCNSLTYVQLPPHLTEIPENCFRRCMSLLELEIPPTVKKIQSFAFQDCADLETILIPEGVTEIHAYAFQDCVSLEEVILPSTLTYLGQGVFEGCSRLETVVFQSSVKEIPAFAFSECYSLKNISFYDDQIELGLFSFSYETLLSLEPCFSDTVHLHEKYLSFVNYYDPWIQWFSLYENFPSTEKDWKKFFSWDMT